MLGPLLLFLAVCNLFRVALFAMARSGAITPEHPLDSRVSSLVVGSELVIGLVGLAAIPGLIGSRAWGFWVSVAVSFYAIAFDAASVVAVQASATGGVVPPALVLLFLMAIRRRLRPEAGGPMRTRACAGLSVASAAASRPAKGSGIVRLRAQRTNNPTSGSFVWGPAVDSSQKILPRPPAPFQKAGVVGTRFGRTWGSGGPCHCSSGS